MTRTALRLLGAAAAFALVAGALTSAQARTDRMEYSEDGVTWHATPPMALFEEGIVLVPGGAASATLHLRSLAETSGVLTLGLLNADASSDAAAEAFGVSILKSSSDTIVSPERQPMAELTDRVASSSGTTLGPGETVAVTVTVDLDAEVTGSVAQNSSIDLDLLIRFADAAGGSGEPDSDGTDGTSSEPAAERDPASPAPDLIIPLVPDDHHDTGETGPAGTASGSAQSNPRGHESTDPAGDDGGITLPAGLAMTGIQHGLLLLTSSVLVGGGLFVAVGRTRRRQL